MHPHQSLYCTAHISTLKCCRKGHINVSVVGGPATANAQPLHAPTDVPELSVDGWKPNGDAVVMQSQQVVLSALPDTAE